VAVLSVRAFDKVRIRFVLAQPLRAAPKTLGKPWVQGAPRTGRHTKKEPRCCPLPPPGGLIITPNGRVTREGRASPLRVLVAHPRALRGRSAWHNERWATPDGGAGLRRTGGTATIAVMQRMMSPVAATGPVRVGHGGSGHRGGCNSRHRAGARSRHGRQPVAVIQAGGDHSLSWRG
jgi:hypothetical protein